jgi:hypothetical protein
MMMYVSMTSHQHTRNKPIPPHTHTHTHTHTPLKVVAWWFEFPKQDAHGNNDVKIYDSLQTFQLNILRFYKCDHSCMYTYTDSFWIKALKGRTNYYLD